MPRIPYELRAMLENSFRQTSTSGRLSIQDSACGLATKIRPFESRCSFEHKGTFRAQGYDSVWRARHNDPGDPFCCICVQDLGNAVSQGAIKHDAKRSISYHRLSFILKREAHVLLQQSLVQA